MIILGEERTIDMQAIYTNVHGDTNSGNVLDIHESGLFQISWEPFTQLLERIVRRNASHASIAKESLGRRVGWSRLHDDGKSSLVVILEKTDSEELISKYNRFLSATFVA